MIGCWRANAAAGMLVLVAACDGASDSGDDNGDDVVPACIEYTLDGCAQLYPPTYDQVWAQTLTNGCAEFGTACHAQSDAAGAKNGLTFTDPQQSHDHLLMSGERGPLVVPGDPLCSPLFVRLATDDASIRMPPGGSSLAPGALCSIATWIADGAAP
ncbi:hypothetical protein DB30_00845 [Enhygromyxa salina]|uniref:Cytochrome C Planctomycete-type domain-containing protein n=1 Tax=Enhygromyxa salina TaxID=215803 RepID=A0A0C2CP04_9BACT|nr:c-type cytochrome domain-containing protein [Enhygromyxa salina]KIG12961.1 hypothetical protein DB30_00845 [Enhygromyxa salina]